MTRESLPSQPRTSMKEARGFEYILHPSDFTEGDQPAFFHALRLAVGAKAQLQLLHIRQADEDTSWGNFPGVTSTLGKWNLVPRGATHSDVKALGLDVLKVQHTGKNVKEQIERFAAERRPDLIVLATNQRDGIERALHASMAEPIARDTRTMTLFVPRGAKGFVNSETGEARLKNILVPVDRSPNPQGAFDAAARIAETLGCLDAHFTLFHAGNSEDMPVVKDILRWSWTSEKRAWKGNAVENILKTAEAVDADLIVMATHGHHGLWDALRGSTTERVLRGAAAPVLAAPAF